MKKLFPVNVQILYEVLQITVFKHYHFTTLAACTIGCSVVLDHSASSWIQLGS